MSEGNGDNPTENTCKSNRMETISEKVTLSFFGRPAPLPNWGWWRVHFSVSLGAVVPFLLMFPVSWPV